MIYYIIFAFLVATCKTYYYIWHQQWDILQNTSTSQIIATVIITFVISFLFAPLILVEESIKYMKNRRKQNEQ